MNEDMMEMVKKMSEMMGNKEIPEGIKNVLNSMNANNNNNVENSQENSTNNKENDFETNQNHNTEFNEQNRSNNSNNNFNFENIMGNIDINTILKIQQIMNSLNNDKQNDYRSNLLLALKPYVRESRRDKVDTYIQLMKMGKIIEVINPMGGDKGV